MKCQSSAWYKMSLRAVSSKIKDWVQNNICVLSSKLSVKTLGSQSTSECEDSLTAWVCLYSQKTQADCGAGGKAVARTNPDSTHSPIGSLQRWLQAVLRGKHEASRRSVHVKSFNLLGYHKNRYCLVPNKMDQVAIIQKTTDDRPYMLMSGTSGSYWV